MLSRDILWYIAGFSAAVFTIGVVGLVGVSFTSDELAVIGLFGAGCAFVMLYRHGSPGGSQEVDHVDG